MDDRCVGVIGGASLTGECLLPLLRSDGRRVIAFSRRVGKNSRGEGEEKTTPGPLLGGGGGIIWRGLGVPVQPLGASPPEQIAYWVCVAPAWVLPEHFTLLERAGARRLVMLSSTSRFTKSDSSDAFERTIALRLSRAEDALRRWAESNNIEWVVLRPTLIYGRGRDKNITEIARFIRRFGFFPLIGRGMGLRQPVYAGDVASACVGALKSAVAVNRAYNLSGGETLTYREMVARVFVALRRHPRLVKVPRHFFRMAVQGIRLLPSYRHWTPAMVERMNHDLVFDHTDAERDFSFSPRSFYLAPEDLPR